MGGSSEENELEGRKTGVFLPGEQSRRDVEGAQPP